VQFLAPLVSWSHPPQVRAQTDIPDWLFKCSYPVVLNPASAICCNNLNQPVFFSTIPG
jgi:hypothetical protein